MNVIPANYWNSHDHHSILLQGICNANIMFWNVCVRAHGETHDATRFRDSFLYKDFLREICFVRTNYSTRLSTTLNRLISVGNTYSRWKR